MERISGEDGDRLAEFDVACGLPPSQVVVIHRGKIVMNERKGVE